MIEIKLMKPQHIGEICGQLGVKMTPELQVYDATSKGEPLGCCGFEMDGSNGVLVFTHMESDGLAPIEDGLLRSSLSLMFESGVATVTCNIGVPCAVPEKMLKALGFKQKDKLYSLNLNNSFLTQGCHCANDKK